MTENGKSWNKKETKLRKNEKNEKSPQGQIKEKQNWFFVPEIFQKHDKNKNYKSIRTDL